MVDDQRGRGKRVGERAKFRQLRVVLPGVVNQLAFGKPGDTSAKLGVQQKPARSEWTGAAVH
ncbi:hypothetical protein D3C72_2001800 [compost metagenome]